MKNWKSVMVSWVLLGGMVMEAGAKDGLRVFQLNIWQEGTKVPEGFAQMIDAIVASEADVVAFSEVRNYKGEDLHGRVVAALAAKGKEYHGSHVGGDVGLVSRFPVKKAEVVVDKTNNDRGSIMASYLDAGEGRELVVCTAHLDYTHYAVYLPRGYDANSFRIIDADGDGEPDPVTDRDGILKVDADSQRDEALQAFLEFAGKHPDAEVVLAGDFNEASHLDWTVGTKDMFGRNGVAMDWGNSKRLKEAGFVDCFREIFPDPATHPGMTWPSDVSDGKTTTWAPKVDERDRIDFIYYKGSRMKAKAAFVAGSKRYFVKGVLAESGDETPFLLSDKPWMSDHKGVVVDFDWKE